jgi:hypothetical protein
MYINVPSEPIVSDFPRCAEEGTRQHLFRRTFAPSRRPPQSASTYGTTRNVATPAALEESQDEPRQEVPTGTDKPRPVATAYVERLESENDFLRGQIGVKDNTIAALLEPDRETNHLIAGLQRVLTAPLGRSEPTPPDTH